MKIAVYTDYFYGLPEYGGGGETYAIFMSWVLSKNHDVDVYTNKIDDSEVNIFDVYKYYNIPKSVTDKINFYPAQSIGWKPKRFEREKKLRKYFEEKINNKYDVFINASDNTLQGFANTKTKTKYIKINHFPWSNFTARKYYLTDLIRNIKYINSYDVFLCNSKFTCKWHKKIHKIDANVLYPPIRQETLDIQNIKLKENIILCAGRIVDTKKTLILAKSFVKFWNENKNYKLIIAGNFDPEHRWYYDSIVKELKNTNYEILKDVEQDKLNNLYKKSKFFWSATGYKESEPRLAEHFGMTTVESMANGCVPIVVNNGGSAEILTKKSGLCYNEIDELIAFTEKLSKDENLFEKYSKEAIERSKMFLIDEFEKKLNYYL